MPRTAVQTKPPSEAQLAAREAGAARLKAASAARRNVAPASIRPAIESERHVQQERPRTLSSTGPAEDALDAPQVEIAQPDVSREKLDELAFMEEPVRVLVHDSTNPTDEQVPRVWNDGRPEFFVRNVEKVVKRKFVEVLARMKKTTYTQRKEKDDNGVEYYVNVPHSALQFPFAVIDDTQRGRAWLARILAER